MLVKNSRPSFTENDILWAREQHNTYEPAFQAMEEKEYLEALERLGDFYYQGQTEGAFNTFRTFKQTQVLLSWLVRDIATACEFIAQKPLEEGTKITLDDDTELIFRTIHDDEMLSITQNNRAEVIMRATRHITLPLSATEYEHPIMYINNARGWEPQHPDNLECEQQQQFTETLHDVVTTLLDIATKP